MMFLAAPLVAAWSLQPCPPPHRLHRSRAPVCSLGSLCTEQTFELNRQLDLGKESEASRSISALHATSIAPLLPAVWSSEFPDREDAIVKLSAVLDELEADPRPLCGGLTVTSPTILSDKPLLLLIQYLARGMTFNVFFEIQFSF